MKVLFIDIDTLRPDHLAVTDMAGIRRLILIPLQMKESASIIITVRMPHVCLHALP